MARQDMQNSFGASQPSAAAASEMDFGIAKPAPTQTMSACGNVAWQMPSTPLIYYVGEPSQPSNTYVWLPCTYEQQPCVQMMPVQSSTYPVAMVPVEPPAAQDSMVQQGHFVGGECAATHEAVAAGTFMTPLPQQPAVYGPYEGATNMGYISSEQNPHMWSYNFEIQVSNEKVVVPMASSVDQSVGEGESCCAAEDPWRGEWHSLASRQSQDELATEPDVDLESECGAGVQYAHVNTLSASGCDSECPTSRQEWKIAEPEKAIVIDAEGSVASSTCSTAPSTRRRRKPRGRGVERQAEANKHRSAQQLAQDIVSRKDALTRQLEGGKAASAAAVRELRGAVWQLSMDAAGCRIVQAAIDKACGPERAQLIDELHGHVREAMGSPHANYVIQRVVEVMPIEIASFVAKELLGIAADASRHRYGCRILCRLVEHYGSSPQVEKLVQEMMKEVSDLARHTFGHHVVQAVLEHGLPAHRHIIAEELAKELFSNATSRNGSYVIERALGHCDEQDANMLAEKLAGEDILGMAQTQFGIYVVKALMETSGAVAMNVTEKVYNATAEVCDNKHYKKLMELLEDDVDASA